MKRSCVLAAALFFSGLASAARAEPAAAADPSSGATGAADPAAPSAAEPAPVDRAPQQQPSSELSAVAFTTPSFGPRYTIERVVVRGNRKTEAALVLGEIGLRPGDQVTASDPRVEAARFRLLSLGFFLDVRLALERGSQRGGAVLVVDVEERGTVILNALYLGASAATPFWGGLDVAENNLLGRGISLGGGFVASTRPTVTEATPAFGARVRALVPPLGDTGLTLSGTAMAVVGSEFFRTAGPSSSAEPSDFIALRTKRVGGVVGLGRALSQSARLIIDFREEGVTAELPVMPIGVPGPPRAAPIGFEIQPGFSRIGSVTATFDFDTRSDPLVPRAGTHLALSVEGATDDLGSSYEFVKLVTQGSFYRPAWHGHIWGFHVFGGALFGDAPFFDQFFVGDMNLFLPPRALGLNFSTQPSRNLLGTSIAMHRYDNFASRVLVEYAIPLWRRRRIVYSGDFFVALGAFGMGSRDGVRDPSRSGFAAWPVDLTGDLGVRLDTTIGVFTLSIANALGRVPF